MSENGEEEAWGWFQDWTIEELIRHAISKHVEGHSTTYTLPNGAKLVIPVGFANKEKSE